MRGEGREQEEVRRRELGEGREQIIETLGSHLKDHHFHQRNREPLQALNRRMVESWILNGSLAAMWGIYRRKEAVN